MQSFSFSLNVVPKPTVSSIWIGSGGVHIDSAHPKRIVVVDEGVPRRVVDKITREIDVIRFHGGERVKTRKMKEWLEDELIKKRM